MDLDGTRLSTSRIDLSIIVSTYNRRQTLARAIDSLLDQRVPASLRYEIIVVDNNCTDATRELIANYVRSFPARVRYAFESRPGVSNGRNAGVRAARGAIVAFTDDDNVVSKTWVATIAALLRAHPDAEGVGGKVLPEWPRTPPAWLDQRHWSPLAILYYGERRLFTSARRPLCLLTANLAIRRDTLLLLGGFSPEFPRCQDHELLLRLWRSGGKVLYAPDLVTFAPVDPQRLTRRYHRKWHAQHGRYAAAMRLEEVTDERGQLRPTPPATARLLGTPGYVYADALRTAWRWVVASLRRRSARAINHEHRLRYLAAYLRRTSVLSRGARPGIMRDVADFALDHLRRRAKVVGLPAGRIATVHALVGLLLIGSAFDIVTGREHWPFSPYPMFSAVERSRTLDSLLLTGVSADSSGREFVLRDAAFIAPFDQCRLNTALQRARSTRDGGVRLRAMLQDTLRRYEFQRERGSHDGPPLRAVRVYEAHWTLDAQATNVDSPDRTRLIDEIVAAPPSVIGVGN
jgi:GT2 family glycosyltransferase